MTCKKMKKRYKKLEITMGNFPFRIRRNGPTFMKKKQVISMFALLGVGILACVFCYATYFPGVMWITPPPSMSTSSSGSNRVLHERKTGLEEKQPPSGSFKLKDFWKFWSSYSSSQEMNESGKFVPKHFSVIEAKERKEKQESVIHDRQTCNFPRLNPFDPSIIEFIKEPPNINCYGQYPLIFRTNFQNKLIQIKKLENSTCCYRTMTRGNGSDHNVKYSKKCYPINRRETQVHSSHEFIAVKCTQATSFSQNPTTTSTISKLPSTTVSSTTSTNYKDMFAFVPLKPSVESRIQTYELNRQNKIGGNPANKINSVGRNEDKLSVLILGLDAQSHMNFIRQMPMTYNFLVKNLSAIGLHGYTKVGDNTFPNVVPLLSGLNVGELKRKCWPTKLSYFDGCPFIWKKFASQGFRTSFAEDSIWMSTFHYEKKGFLNPPTDYYFHPLSLLMAKKIGHETWGNAKLCYGPRLTFEVLLDYIVKTAVRFRNKLYFQYVWANSLFHDYLNNPKLGDELLYLTLEYLNRNGYMNKTIFILLSDHGIRWGSIRSTYQGKIEERMPLAYFTFPPWFRDKYSQAIGNLMENSARLTTPFDIYETLLDILDLERTSTKEMVAKRSKGNNHKVPRGISLFRPIPPSRTCRMAGIEEHWCVCHSMKPISRNSSLVKNAAEFIVKDVNRVLSKFSSCAKLKLYKVNEAMRKIDGDVDRGVEINLNISNSGSFMHNLDGEKIKRNVSVLKLQSSKTMSWNKTVDNDKTEGKEMIKKDEDKKQIQLQITLVTKPSDAVFEATVYGSSNGNSWKLSGDISRLNLYGDQSLCIKDYIAQKYCFCKNQSDNYPS